MQAKKPILFFGICAIVAISAVSIALGALVLPYTKYQLWALFFMNIAYIILFCASIFGMFYAVVLLKKKKNNKDELQFSIIFLITTVLCILLFGWMLNNYFMDGFGLNQARITAKISLSWCPHNPKDFTCMRCIDVNGDSYSVFCGYYENSDLKYLGENEYDANRPTIQYQLEVLKNSRYIISAEKIGQ
jgi:hypothetical protein